MKISFSVLGTCFILTAPRQVFITGSTYWRWIFISILIVVQQRLSHKSVKEYVIILIVICG